MTLASDRRRHRVRRARRGRGAAGQRLAGRRGAPATDRAAHGLLAAVAGAGGSRRSRRRSELPWWATGVHLALLGAAPRAHGDRPRAAAAAAPGSSIRSSRSASCSCRSTPPWTRCSALVGGSGGGRLPRGAGARGARRPGARRPLPGGADRPHARLAGDLHRASSPRRSWRPATSLVLLATRRVGMRSLHPVRAVPRRVARSWRSSSTRGCSAVGRAEAHSTDSRRLVPCGPMHPALQRRRRHLMMTRRTTRRGSQRRGLATFLLVTLGVFGLMFVGSIMGTAGGMFAAYNYFASDLPDPNVLDGIEPAESTYVYDRTGRDPARSLRVPEPRGGHVRRAARHDLAGDRRERGPHVLGEQRRRLPGHRARRARQPRGGARSCRAPPPSRSR